jgi:putative NADH-flavin reductase
MKILILGATGPTGRHVIDCSLTCGDSVTVLARNPAALGDLSERLTVIQGDATSEGDVSGAMRGCDAVIATLGRGNSLVAHELFSRAATAALGAARQQGVSRLVWMSSFGVGDTFASANALQKFLFRTLMRGIYADKAIADSAIRASDLEWTIVYPSALTNGPAKATYRVAERIEMKGMPRISRADVASFMHQMAHDREWIRRAAVIAE